MRKITVLSMISLDGVIQAPGGPEEDTSNGFQYGGWVAPYGDKAYDQAVQEELQQPADYLLGRKTFEIWADYWPKHGDFWPGINEGTKYLFSQKLKNDDPLVNSWKKSVVLGSVEDIRKLKQSEGRDIQVWGSSRLIHLLLENDLVDELRLKIHPLVLGPGKTLWNGKAHPGAFTLLGNTVTSTGVIIAHYRRAGEVKTGRSGPKEES